MPSQMPELSIWVEVSWAITMSTPGSMPSLRTPMTLPVKAPEVGSLPLVTVLPCTAWSAASSATG